MSGESGMQIHESLALLNDLHLIEWLSQDVESSTRTFVNALVSDLLETEDPREYLPSSWSDAVIQVMANEVLLEDWFDLLSGRFRDTVELNADSIGFAISGCDSMLTDREGKQVAIDSAQEWESHVRLVLKQAINGTARR